MKIRKLSIIAIMPFLAITSHAQVKFGLTPYEENVLTAAEPYVNDPQFASSGIDTDSSLKKRKCEEGNFFKMGFNRAFNGKKREKGLKKVKKKCKKVDVVVDETAFFAGYDKGLLGRCSFVYGFAHGRNGTNIEWTKCNSGNFEHYNRGYEIGQGQAPVLRQHSSSKSRVTFLEDKIVLLEYDMNNGTDTAEIGDAKKTDYLVKWNRELKNARATVIKLEARHPEVFNTTDVIAENLHFVPYNWKDSPK